MSLKWVLGSIAGVTLLLSACTGRPSEPEGYGATTRANFTSGCARSAAAQGVTQPRTYCRCAYDGLTESVPFEEFRSINDDLEATPQALPARLLAVRDRCLREAAG